ncbi:TetR/AcrR family transcriptional regulator [Microbacterium sp. HD4P20]|uniref:TetR/AcrR family transcriptional regulator n=1 Tax=Microbacterium sp. HD4P20 TaxID=2864874 RepID=UPI001C644C2D|nr:TetR/AcrR family transcriptional regulator [Microbacterium sp. HD4P20]MCP2635037.1 TetR/AcrR family transcriptional regulator [Microbacterium sp. HD4P20]
MTTAARERRRSVMRDDILTATLGLIEDGGLGAATIESIAERAGVARATVYAHFPDGRDEMLRAAYDRAGRMLLDLARARVAAFDAWEERIEEYARTMIEFSSGGALGRFYSVSGPALVGFREGGGAGSRGYREAIGAELAAARERGELSADADPESLAVLLSSSLRDAGIAAARDPESAERFVRAIRCLLDGLKTARHGEAGQHGRR